MLAVPIHERLLFTLILVNEASSWTHRGIAWVLSVDRGKVPVAMRASQRIRTLLLGVSVHNQDLASSILFDELLHRHLNEHVIIHFVRAASLQLSSNPAVDCCLLSPFLWACVLLHVLPVVMLVPNGLAPLVVLVFHDGCLA